MRLKTESEKQAKLTGFRNRVEAVARGMVKKILPSLESIPLDDVDTAFGNAVAKLPPEKQAEWNEIVKELGELEMLLAAAGIENRYYLKAMNCPHHHKLFAAVPRSYRDLPLRLAEYGTCYRYEKSGELFGLMRVRSLQMNDAHIYCTAEQFEAEFNAVNEMYLNYFKLFGIQKYLMRFSTHHAP